MAKDKKTILEPLNSEDLIGFEHWKGKTALFLSSQTVSLFGSSLVQFAIIWYITLSTKSGNAMMISSLCGFVPQIIISLFSGVWADRYSRKHLIMGADALVAGATFVLAMFFFSGHDDLYMVFIVLAVRSLGTGIQTPAVNAVLPQIVPQKRLIRIGGISNSLQSVMFLLSPAASGAILSFASIEYTLLIDIITAVVAIIIMSTIKIPLHERAKEKQKGGYFEDLKKGISYSFSNGFLRTFFIFFFIFMFMAVPVAQLTPLMVARTFGDEVWRLSLMEVLFSAGSVIGGVIITVWGGFKNRMHTVSLAALLFGVFTIVMGTFPYFGLFIVLMGVTGLFVPFFSTPSMVMLQEQVDQGMQGRVFSLLQIVMTTALPLGMAFFGPLADIYKVEALLVVTGIVIIVLGILVYTNKHFKHGKITE